MERRQCPQCGDGAIRKERVFKGEKAESRLVCDLCAFAWDESDDAKPPDRERERR